MIQIGDRLPAVPLFEYVDTATDSCPIGPKTLDSLAEAAGKTVLLIGVPGAFTPTCAGHHLPGYLAHRDAFVERGVDEIWFLSVNDAFVMNAWSKAAGVGDGIRMLADGSANLVAALGLTMDLSARGMGIRSQRFAMLVKDGTVADLQVEAPGKFEVSKAEAMLARL